MIRQRRGMFSVQRRRVGDCSNNTGRPQAARALHRHLPLGSRDDAIAARHCEGDTAEGSQRLFQGRIAHVSGEEPLSCGPGLFCAPCGILHSDVTRL